VIVQYRSQERKSSTARGLFLISFLTSADIVFLISRNNETNLCCNADEGKNPIWNEVLKFQISSTAANVQHKLILRIMDHDNFSRDDFLGQAT
jgi:hypothetical protein